MIIYIFQEREIKGKKIDRLMQKKERLKESAKTAAEGGEEEGGGERPKVKVDEQIEQLRADIVFIQDNISDCQSNIMQMEESKARNNPPFPNIPFQTCPF